MARRLPEDFKDKELSPLCIVSKLDDAKKVEAVLDSADVDYTFEITPVIGKSVFSILFGGVKDGIMFLIPSDKYELCKTILDKAGISKLLLTDEGEE